MHQVIVKPLHVVFFVCAITTAAIGVNMLFHIWQLAPDGSSPLTLKLPVFDFMNLWAGGDLARHGMINVLFDHEAYNAWLQATFGPNIGISEWSYPPTMLLLGAPLSYLPINAAYLVWTLGTLGGLYFACRALGAGRLVALAACLTPAAFVNIWFGQNGALTASLLIGGLALVERRPWLAGVLLGLLALKPQTALLAPFAVVAIGAWRTVVAGALTAIATAALAGVAFTPDAWWLFFTETQPLMRGILEAPWPQGYQSNCATVFMVMRFLGMGVAASYMVQGAVALGCASICVFVWRRRGLDVSSKAMLTVALAPLMSPYGYVYDLVGFEAVLLVACLMRDMRGIYLVAPIQLWAMLQPLYEFRSKTGPIAGVFVIAGAVLLTRWAISERKSGASHSGAAAQVPPQSSAAAA